MTELKAELKAELKTELKAAAKKAPSFGVCDSPKQMAELLSAGGYKLPQVYHMHAIMRKEQSPYGGFRWHKHGPYVGKHDISDMEYLYEADGEDGRPRIDEQWVFDEFDYQREGLYEFLADGTFRRKNRYLSLEKVMSERSLLEKVSAITVKQMHDAITTYDPYSDIKDVIGGGSDPLYAVAHMFSGSALTSLGIPSRKQEMLQHLLWMSSSIYYITDSIAEKISSAPNKLAYAKEINTTFRRLRGNFCLALLTLSEPAREMLFTWYNSGY